MLLYLHIPFCHRICPYCSFYKHTPGGIAQGKFIDALLKELAIALAVAEQVPRTIFLGGGTPSMLSETHLQQLFTGLHGLIDFSQLAEVSLEANPATFKEKKADLFRQLGVNRVSLGIQSFDDQVLQILGREHSSKQAVEAVRILQQVGLSQVNIDLMFSVPQQTLEQWRASLRQATALQPQHISAYNLTYEEDTAFYLAKMRGEVSECPRKNGEFFELAHDLLGAAGFEHYETSNYARNGHRSLHNEGYWRGEDYLGIGPSAVSTLRGVRRTNVADTATYMNMIETLGNAQVEAEILSQEDQRVERLAMGLRTREGVRSEWLCAAARPRVEVLCGEGLLEWHDARLRTTRTGMALVDAIVAELM